MGEHWGVKVFVQKNLRMEPLELGVKLRTQVSPAEYQRAAHPEEKIEKLTMLRRR